MTTEVKKLINSLETVKETGIIQTNKNGVKYRYDTFTSKFSKTPNWLAQIFKNAANSVGQKYSQQFYCDEYSFYFDRAKFASQPNGKITYKKLIKF